MKNLTLLMIAVWSLIGLAIIAVIVFFTISSSNDKEGSFTDMIFGETDTSNMQIVAEETVSMHEVKKVDLEFFSETCNIYFTDSESIELKHYARNVPQGQYARTKLTGDTLYISTKPQGLGSFLSFNFMSRSTVDIILPETYRESVSIYLASGKLRFYGDVKLSDLSVKISSGTIRSEHAVEAQNVDITVTSGAVKLTGGIKAGHYALKASSGNLDIGSHLTGSGSINVISGGVKLAGVDITESLDVNVSSGNISIGIAGNPSLRFSGKKSSGTLRTYFQLDEDGSAFSATFGEAPYKDLNVQVISGTIRILQD